MMGEGRKDPNTIKSYIREPYGFVIFQDGGGLRTPSPLDLDPAHGVSGLFANHIVKCIQMNKICS